MELEPTRPLNLRGGQDNLFETSKYPIPFEFNADVVSVFDNMINRSVPLYHEVSRTVVELAKRFYTDGSKIVDVGCSTGTTIEMLAHAFSRINKQVELIGVDPSRDMLDEAQSKLDPFSDQHKVSLVETEAHDASYENASVVIMNYTLQFIPVMERRSLLAKIQRQMRPGGMLFLSEKVRSNHAAVQEVTTLQYERFKEGAGYSRTEIERKKEALDRVLVPLSYQEMSELLSDVGYKQVEPILRWHNFTSFIALKK